MVEPERRSGAQPVRQRPDYRANVDRPGPDGDGRRLEARTRVSPARAATKPHAGAMASRPPRASCAAVLPFSANRIRRVLRLHELERPQPRDLGRTEELPRYCP